MKNTKVPHGISLVSFVSDALFTVVLAFDLQVAYLDTLDEDQFCHLLAIPSKERLTRVLKYLLDEEEFLSPYGIRSLSKIHEKYPFVMQVGGEQYCVNYVPGESNTHIFGGNSNWRGPIWLCGKISTHSLTVLIVANFLYKVVKLRLYCRVVYFESLLEH